MRANRFVKICPICHKAFTNKDNQKIAATCSLSCGMLFARHDKYARERLVELAAERKRPPRTDCRMYLESGDCSALTALWCVYEDCKFYKSRGENNGEEEAG